MRGQTTEHPRSLPLGLLTVTTATPAAEDLASVSPYAVTSSNSVNSWGISEQLAQREEDTSSDGE
ncbi:hypothetical protein JG687_00012370 [Phytophthora cactorum]|uniref:Uncharacterized protein n=1 Tax=Phytophthora cactorum TaxID=29920 RepID=A0A329RMG8_9STRA|nr:hypothetical protein Pcac1_g3038 [Phytophthora cactorum]KAG2821767.1 hypothetical protein PC112_g11215 [Phytophthora cactorum]KAG2835652.1 hypothetical protein PC111_g5331 [Phytophthora cactorum]KAG2864352.1 hypothetical protein PC113_g4669 [Phytophthora cactorum]KAG2901918.1 hypothetical protein PC114_g12969 [Phytophthora cactorum]